MFFFRYYIATDLFWIYLKLVFSTGQISSCRGYQAIQAKPVNQQICSESMLRATEGKSSAVCPLSGYYLHPTCNSSMIEAVFRCSDFMPHAFAVYIIESFSFTSVSLSMAEPGAPIRSEHIFPKVCRMPCEAHLPRESFYIQRRQGNKSFRESLLRLDALQ